MDGSAEADIVLTRRLPQACLLLVLCALSAAAQASYGQMRLDGIGLLLALMLTVACGVIVDVALLARLFRHRAALVTGLGIAVAILLLLVGMAASPGERAGFFKGPPGGASLVVAVLTCAVFLPFIVLAPLAQYRALREGRRWPRGLTAGMVLQVALLPGFFVLAHTEAHFWQEEYAAGLAVGRGASAGELGGILVRAEQQRERLWGTGWTYARHQEPSRGHAPRLSGWITGLARGVDASPLIAANEPLREADRVLLRELMERHFAGVAMPMITAKLLWDALEPGNFSGQLAPHGLNERGVVSEEVLPLLLDRLEANGEARLCPGGRMMDADRDVLMQLVVARAQAHAEAKERELKATIDAKRTAREMAEAPAPYRLLWEAANALGEAYGGQAVVAPDWSGFPRRVEGLCGGQLS
ncbi:MAG: hypothetical protein K0Q68_1976 [Moraxellaceae bacterium]|jgi:hypothetical protein|nr:hypothetical protein [Moraxellaceae bacterium]